MVRNYVPSRGDVVWLNFSPTVGNEQAGRRPGVVLSSVEYNKKVGLCLVCPITSKVKGYSYEVVIKKGEVKGVALSNQVTSVAYGLRDIKKITTVGEDVLSAIVGKINFLIS